MGNWPGRPMPERRKELDAALNEIMIWVWDNLPEGWAIEIRMGAGEASMDLIDPKGECVSDDWDGDNLNLWRMVDHANNPDVFGPEGEE